MSLKDRLAFDALRNDIAELCLALEKHNCSWNGKSWKFPNQLAKFGMKKERECLVIKKGNHITKTYCRPSGIPAFGFCD